MVKNMTFLMLTCMICLGGIPRHAHGQSVDELMSTGNSLMQAGNYNQAATAYREVLRREPDNFEAQRNLALAYHKWGRHSNAVAEFKKALRLNSGDAFCWYHMGLSYVHLGQSSRAMECFVKARNLSPGESVYYSAIALLYEKDRNYEAALDNYQRAKRLDPHNGEANEGIIRCCRKLGKNRCREYR